MSGRISYRFLTIAAIGTVLCVAVILVAANRPIRLAYHSWRMNSAWDTVLRDLSRNGQTTDPRPLLAFEHHKKALVQLNYLQERTIRLKHIAVPSPQSKALWKSLMEASEESPLITMQGYEANTVDAVILCGRPEDNDAWEVLIAKHDRPQRSPDVGPITKDR
jgi:hypothetical protein